jgi:hypothetical protein
VPACVETGSRARCGADGTLAFVVERSAQSPSYLALLARTPDGGVLWYAPEATGQSLVLDPGVEQGRALREGVALAGSHAAGDYDVLVVWSDRPLSREQLRAQLGPELRGGAGLRIERYRFVVESAP